MSSPLWYLRWSLRGLSSKVRDTKMKIEWVGGSFARAVPIGICYWQLHLTRLEFIFLDGACINPTVVTICQRYQMAEFFDLCETFLMRSVFQQKHVFIKDSNFLTYKYNTLPICSFILFYFIKKLWCRPQKLLTHVVNLTGAPTGQNLPAPSSPIFPNFTRKVKPLRWLST